MKTHTLDTLGDISSDISIALGVFDGVHLGHQKVIKSAVDFNKNKTVSVVATFDPIPSSILKKGPIKRILTSLPHKEIILEQLGIDCLLVIEFNHAMAELSPEEFVENLINKSNHQIKHIAVGEKWLFGKNREGDVHNLVQLGKQHNFNVTAVPSFYIGNEMVSSTKIRKSIEQGDFSSATKYLGRPYTVLGQVVDGRKLGRTIGYPTANLKVWNEVLPPEGVYGVKVNYGNKSYHGVANLGRRPTIESDQGKRLLEVHILDFDKTIYGELLEVTFLNFIRNELTFSSTDELVTQIETDINEFMSFIETIPAKD